MAVTSPIRVDRERFAREGYLVIEDVFDPAADLDPVVHEYAAQLDEIAADHDWVWNSKAKSNGTPKNSLAATKAKGRATVRLEPKAIEVLVHLARHPGEVVGRESLLAALWPGVIVGDDALTQAIIKLRRAA